MKIDPDPRCTLCGEPSVARFFLPEGCQAYPGRREQELCAQHLVSVEPIEMMEPLVVHHQPLYELILGGAA